MELENNYNLLQDNTITILKKYPRFLTLLKVIANRLENLQECADFLSEIVLNVDKAEGIWLDYTGWLIGVKRKKSDILKYFCVNAPHLNVEKLFYFGGSSSDDDLDDVIYRKQIKAKIAYNTSRCTRNENIKIITDLLNADKVIISNYAPMTLDITIYGDNIVFPSVEDTRGVIENILGNGVGIRNLTILGSNEI